MNTPLEDRTKALARWVAREVIGNEMHDGPPLPSIARDDIARALVEDPFLGWPDIESAQIHLDGWSWTGPEESDLRSDPAPTTRTGDPAPQRDRSAPQDTRTELGRAVTRMTRPPGTERSFFIIEHPTRGVLKDLEETAGGSVGRFGWSVPRNEGLRYHSWRAAQIALSKITPESKRAKCEIRQYRPDRLGKGNGMAEVWPMVGP